MYIFYKELFLFGFKNLFRSTTRDSDVLMVEFIFICTYEYLNTKVFCQHSD